MLKEPIEKESIFNVNPSKPSESNYIITDLYTSFEQISVPDKQARGTILTRSHMLNPSLWGALMVLGLLTSFIGFTVDYLSQKLLQTRLYISSSDNSLWNVTIWLVYSLFFAVIATSTGKFMSSDAEGSGIPEVKSILSGIHINKYLSISTLSAKIVGLISASAAGLSIGKEGPFVHISAILANKMTKINYMRGLQNVFNN
jgi:H+/Cl- antiporter ClcA